SIGSFIAQAIIKQLIEADKLVRQANVVIMGITFKEDTPDARNSKVFDIVDSLKEYGIRLTFVDEQVDREEARNAYEVELTELDSINNADCLVFAVAHKEFKNLNVEDLHKFYKNDLDNNEKVLIDIKGIFNTDEVKKEGLNYW